MKKFAICTVICLLLLSVNHAKADLMLTAVDGDWSNPVIPSSSIYGDINYYNDVVDTYGNLLQDQIRWGDPVKNGGGEQSGLGFTGAATSSPIVLGDAFQIGRLAHFNEPIYLDSIIESADLTIKLTFGTGAHESFLYTLGINETLNTTDAAASADIISFPSSYPEERFYISGELHTLQLLGFGSDPLNLLSEFSSPEGGTNDTLLWGRIVQTPVPGAFLLGMLGLGVAGVKLRKYA
jgi:hypothetical protein